MTDDVQEKIIDVQSVITQKNDGVKEKTVQEIVTLFESLKQRDAERETELLQLKGVVEEQQKEALMLKKEQLIDKELSDFSQDRRDKIKKQFVAYGLEEVGSFIETLKEASSELTEKKMPNFAKRGVVRGADDVFKEERIQLTNKLAGMEPAGVKELLDKLL